MKIIGLTGGIGSGKSTVAKMFKDLGISVYDSDKKAKKLMRTSKKIRKKIIALLGSQAYDGVEINRGYIAGKVFKDTDLLAKLNAIVHPAVRKNFGKWVQKQEGEYVIQETALLFENKAQAFYDKTILVVTPKKIRVERLLKRDLSSKKQILDRMNNQLEDEIKLPLADYVIENIDLEETVTKVKEVHKHILDF